MKKFTLTSVVSVALVATLPTQSQADLKDALIGATIGAIIVNEAQKSRTRSAPRATVSTRSAPRSTKPATLNSQYSRAEKRQIQTALNSLGYNVGVVDGSLGRNSRAGISGFQASRGEAATGQLTRTQYSALVASLSNPSAAFVVDRALSRQEVVLMQTALQQMGFYTQRIDGQKGPGTRGARNAFLQSRGYNLATTTQVQAAVLAASAAGQFVPPYLMQEAQTQFQMANGTAPVAAPQLPQTQGAGFAPTAPQQGFVQQPQQVFVPQPQQGFVQQPQQGFVQQPQQGFVQQPQQGFVQQPQQGFVQQPPQAFAPQQGGVQQPKQGFVQQPQQAFAPQPQPLPGSQQPQQGFAQQPQVNTLFGTPQPAQPQGQTAPAAVAPAPQQGQGILVQQQQPAPTSAAAAPQLAAQTGTATVQQPVMSFTGTQAGQSGLDIFTPAPAPSK